MNFQQVAIDEVWAAIQPVAALLLSEEEQETLLRAARDGRAVCLYCEAGILVVHPNINPADHELEYHCWWGQGNEGVTAAFEQMLPTIVRDARKMGCRRVVYDTERPGMMRKGIRSGFYVRNIEMVMDLAEGELH